MKPNENVYGAPSQWYSQHFTQNIPLQYRNKKPYFGGANARLETAIANNKIIGGQPIDKTISYCGLGSESDLSHANSICRINGDIVIKTADRKVTNFMIWEKSSSHSFARMNGALCDNNQYGWKERLTSDNINRYIEPLCSIKPTNQVLEIRVFAYSPTLNTTIDVDLDTYCSGSFIAYPQIQTVYVECQWGSSPERGANIPNYEYMNVKFCIGVLDAYKYIDDTDVYNYALSAQDRSNIGILSGLSNPVYNINAVSDNIPIFYGGADMYTVATTSGTMVRVYRDVSRENIDDVKEYYLRQAACLGLYFSPKHSVAINGTLTDPDMYIGILDENGIGHGDYLRGANTVNAPQNNLQDMFDVGYNPQNADDTDYQNNTQFYAQLPPKSFLKYWVLTESQVNQLANELYQAIISAPSGESIEAYSLKTFLTMNPIDAVISLMRFPCNPLTGLISSPVKLGTYQTSINAYPLLFQTFVYDFTFSRTQKNSLFPVNNKDFRDYEPYTKCELIVPFCGSVEIPCTYIYDYDDLTVHLIVDFLTGVCTAVITCNDIAIDTVSGTCAIPLPITGVQSATLDQQIHSIAHQKDTINTTNAASLLASGAAAAIGFATGNLVTGAIATIGALGTALNYQNKAEQISYELEHMNVPLKQIEAASGAIAQSMDMRCRLRITRPITSKYDSEAYAQTIGYSIISAGSVSDYHGYTIGEINVDNIEATTAERDMIKNAFRVGVYLP